MATIRYISTGCLSFFWLFFANATPPINGAGATFPYPLYAKWFAEFEKVDANAKINYQPIGSGGGIRQLLEKTIDFGATDTPMSDEQLTQAARNILHFPTALGAVVITYNLPEITSHLKLSGELIADIFLGKIKKWSDPRIVKLNEKLPLPTTDILVVHRSDGSGTTGIFTDYLTKVSPAWKTKVGSGAAINWPTGLGGKGNDGVSGLVKQTPGSIGYVELIYAKNSSLPYAWLQNRAGTIVEPTPKSVSAAASGALKTMPADFRISITDAEGKDSYPLSGFTYLLVYKSMPKEKGEKIVNFLNWALKQGQDYSEPLHYAPLPKELIKKITPKVNEITLNP